MKKFLLPILSFFSVITSSYYDIGDVINHSHQNEPLEICYGDNIGETIYLGNNNTGITVIGLENPWWILTNGSMVLEEITNHYQYDYRVSIMQNLDDIGQPYDCEGWANFNDTNSFNIIDDGNGYFLLDLFAIDNYWHGTVIIDHNMVFRYYGCGDTNNTENLINIIDNILFQIDFSVGDINNDGGLNIQDIILIVNIILSNEYNQLADLNNDSIINVLDIVQLVNIILN